MTNPEMMAACGLDCGACSIRRYPFDERAAAEALPWFRKWGWLKDDEGVDAAVGKRLVCHGCHGDRTAHWSADCWILQCCVDGKRLHDCSKCAGFPCSRLVEWSQKDDSYAKALARLREVRGRK